MGAAGNKKPKKPKDKHHVPAYEKEEALNEASKKPRNQKKRERQDKLMFWCE